ncbi:MAG: hypothetical protein ACRD96_03885 [Bryobacteraceae bacterium]
MQFIEENARNLSGDVGQRRFIARGIGENDPEKIDGSPLVSAPTLCVTRTTSGPTFA